jgi:hypothetical protein
MSKVIVQITDGLGSCGVYDVPGLVTAAEKAAEYGPPSVPEDFSNEVITAEIVAGQSNVTSTDDFAEIADDAFTSDEYFLSSGFTVTSGTASWSPEGVRVWIKAVARYRYHNITQKVKDDANLSDVVFVAQASLSSGRSASVQAAFDAINAHMTDLEAVIANVDAASTSTQLKSIFDALPEDPYPPTP